MSLIGILFGIAFITLLIKAIIETVWGCILIAQGMLCHALAAVLDLIASIIRFAVKSGKKPEPEPRQATVSESILLMYSPDSPEAKRIRAAFRRPA